MSQGNVKNFAAMFDQQPIMKPGGHPPPISKKPSKPPVPLKESNNGNVNHINGVHSTGPAKHFAPTPGALAGIPHNIQELGQVRLKKAPPPKPPPSHDPSESPFNRRPSLNKPRPDITNKPKPVTPKPKPKPAVLPRKLSSGSSGPVSPTSQTNPIVPKSDADDSTSRSSSFSDSSLPRTSTTESNTSRTESNTSRRTSGKPEMQVLPPVEELGMAPPKPKKPMMSVVLPSPTASVKPSSKRQSFLYRRHDSSSVPGTPTSIRSQNTAPSEEEFETDEFYDDVVAIKDDNSAPRRPPEPRPTSMIPTIDSDEEYAVDDDIIPTMDSDEENDDVYDDTAPPLPPDIGRLPHVLPPSSLPHGLPPPNLPPPPHLPPNRSPLPSRSPLPITPENSGGDAGHDFDLTYDDVSNPSDGELEQDELYEAVESEFREQLQRNEDGVSIGSSAMEESQTHDKTAKELEAQRKREEKERREQEKQQKKEEERRKREEEKREKERIKKEKEDKKRREKEERDAKKKFGIRGDIEVLETRSVISDVHPEYADKLDLSVSKGEELDILRKEGNPEGKWLARDSQGRFGYIFQNVLKLEIDDGQDVYDDVAAVDPEDAEEIYDVPDTE